MGGRLSVVQCFLCSEVNLLLETVTVHCNGILNDNCIYTITIIYIVLLSPTDHDVSLIPSM